MPQKQNKKGTGKKQVAFFFEAPEAHEVILLGDFNNWNPKSHIMKKDEGGSWKKILFLPKGEYEYRFCVDGQWQNDPRNERCVLNPFGTLNNVFKV